MKNLKKLLAGFAMLICIHVEAQYVSIPDSTFGSWLYNNGFSSCLTGNAATGYQLDTTCPTMLATRTLHFGYFLNASGLEYFKNVDSMFYEDLLVLNSGRVTDHLPVSLKYLNVDPHADSLILPDHLIWLKMSNGNTLLPPAFPSHMEGFDCYNCGTLSSIPILPNTLRYLNLNNTFLPLTGFSTFPDSLRYINVWGSYVSTLPSFPPFLDTLMCSYNRISHLPALPTTMRYVDCSLNQIDSMPAIPASLIYLDCSGNSIASNISSLPASLVYFDCSSNYQITALPALPATLKHLSCAGNSIQSLPPLPLLTYLNCSIQNGNHLPLPSSLPATLSYLDCSNISLSTLPPLPAGLTTLHCSTNQLSSLPTLPVGLTYLDCGFNRLSTLPTLPTSLSVLVCQANQLSSLPSLPASLSGVNCSTNRLSSLPTLPDTLISLACDSNLLTSLPTMPYYLTSLSCANNRLTSLPAMPDTLGWLNCSLNPNLSCLPKLNCPYGIFDHHGPPSGLYISGTAITCLPQLISYVGNFDINPDTIPLCTPSSGCPFYFNISGSVHMDSSASCTADSIHPGHRLRNIKVLLKHNGQIKQQTYLSSLGEYSFKTDSFASYDVAVDTSSLIGIGVVCPVSGSHIVVISATDSVQIDQNYGMNCTTSDVAIVDIYTRRFRPALVSTIAMGVGNLAKIIYNADCNINTSGTVSLSFTGPVQYVGPSIGAMTPTSVSGNTITYSIPDLDSLGAPSYNMSIEMATDSSAALGALVCLTGIISPAIPDGNTADDTLTQCFIVTNSLDPNHKSVSPTTLSTDGGWLTYTVEFQNTGNDTAYTVVVRDTLSPYVDASSFQYLASDHKAVIQLMGNAMTFTFPKINLVDSATNPPLSTGWIQYKVKAKTNLPLTTQVKNTAYIYFDLNPAVVTNTTINTVDTTTHTNVGITNIVSSNSIHLYPNPNRGSFTLVVGQTTNGGGGIGSEYTITDMLGKVIAQETIRSSSQVITLPANAEGVYTLSVHGAVPLRFVVMRN